MSKPTKSLILFISIAFLLPLMMVVLQTKVSNNAICFVLFGIQAAAPSISAIVVFMVNREFRKSISRLFHKDHLAMAIFLPIAIVCLVMIAAKFLLTLIMEEHNSFWGTVNNMQWIIILWAFVAEELGWRGYLEPVLNELSFNKKIIPGIVGVIWCAWHYHYFMQNSIEIPIALFLFSCIIESYIYSFLMRKTNGNLLSAMTFHLMYNLMIHVVAINPSDNNGSLVPYVTMSLMEIVVLIVVKKNGKYHYRQ